MKEKILAPVVEGDAPWIGNVDLGGAFELATLWTVAEKPAVYATHRTVSSFDVRVEKYPLSHEKSAGWIGTESADGMVSVMGVEATQNDFSGVGAVVAVGVPEQDEIGRLRDINALRGKFKTDR